MSVDGRGALSDRDDLAHTGLSGEALVQEADVVLAVGTQNRVPTASTTSASCTSASPLSPVWARSSRSESAPRPSTDMTTGASSSSASAWQELQAPEASVPPPE